MSDNWFDTLGVFDLETTGIDVETSRIVSAYIGVLDAHGNLVEQWNWLANPGVEIPVGASAVHGITTERARAEGRPAAEVVKEIIGVLASLFDRGLAVTIYNAPYDLSLLYHEALRNDLSPLGEPAPIIDPLVLDKAIDKYRKGKRTLEFAAEVYGVSLVDAHDASADAIAAGRVAQAMAKLYPDELAVEARLLHMRQIDWCAEQSADFQDYMRRTHNPDFTTSGLWPVR
ncbi:MAG TPA: 3'-5' exonuclease [Galbitalea sp.]|jgi:DNA polymerase-3 subunit epsilon|nr:3'-5' exonuclease [Galbitalea sp.]